MSLNRTLHTNILNAIFEVSRELNIFPRSLLKNLCDARWSKTSYAPLTCHDYRREQWPTIQEGVNLWISKITADTGEGGRWRQVQVLPIPWGDIRGFLLFYYEHSTQVPAPPLPPGIVRIAEFEIEILEKHFLESAVEERILLTNVGENPRLSDATDFWVDMYNEGELYDEPVPVLPNEESQEPTHEEKMNGAKECLKDLQELVFDEEKVKDKVEEKVYLDMMNKMKEMYNHLS